MARLTPTITTLYSGVSGDRRKVVVTGTIAGTYTTAALSDGGALLTADQLGLKEITYANVTPLLTADAVEEYPRLAGLSTSSTKGVVIALFDKGDNLVTANSTAVTDVTFQAEVYGF